MRRFRAGLLHVVAAAAASLSTYTSFAAAQAPSNDLDANASKTTVFVAVSYWDANTSQIKTTTGGTGVLISDHGDIITAFHVLKEWYKQADEDKKKNPIMIHIGSIFEPGLEAAYEAADKDADFALVRLRRPDHYPAAKMCYVHDLPVRAPIVSYGFSNGSDLSPVEGIFGNANNDDNTWQATIGFAPGMSGGPVYNADGFVVGLVKGGVPETNNNAEITPISWARAVIESRTGVKEGCFGSCARPENGVAGWGKSVAWHEETEWLGGGHNQPQECGRLQNDFQQVHSDMNIEITHTDERSDKDFLGHVTYQYICDGIVRSDPTYIVKPSPACPPP